MCNQLDYQSERHCSKTVSPGKVLHITLDYQSERHCSKTGFSGSRAAFCWITSQNDTAPKQGESYTVPTLELDYQSERHCSKT